MTARIGPAELSLVLLVLCVVVVPVAAIAFARSGRRLDDLGKGTFAIDREEPGAPRGDPRTEAIERTEEVRQMVEASAYRRRERGDGEIDVEAEIDRVLGLEAPDEPGDEPPEEDESLYEGGHAAIRAEIRELVVANNERRTRRGEKPLDVDSEVDRRVREWT